MYGLTFWYILPGDDDGDFDNEIERDRDRDGDRDVELYTLTACGSGAATSGHDEFTGVIAGLPAGLQRQLGNIFVSDHIGVMLIGDFIIAELSWRNTIVTPDRQYGTRANLIAGSSACTHGA